jgi:hypothetical protein
MAELDRCQTCHRPIKWAKTTKDKAIPLDPLRKAWEPESAIEPTAIFEADGRVRILHKDELANVALAPRYVVHWASCPDARRWKEFADRRRARAAAKRNRLELEDAELAELRAANQHSDRCGCNACRFNEDLGLESIVLVPFDGR